MNNSKDLKDHQQIGKELELFFNHEISPGTVFWLPKGMAIFKELEKYIRKITERAGYLETSTPIMVKSQLFKQSGHWEKFGEHNMYNLSLWEDEEKKEILNTIEDTLEKMGPKTYKGITLVFDFQGHEIKAEIDHAVVQKSETESSVETKGIRITNFPVNYSLKPMNCPESTILYRFRQRSYKDLPIRFSELGRLHRREKSGEVNGLLRVRQLTMDDAHIYCSEDQILEEVSNILDLIIKFYESLGFEYEFRFATRPETRAGTDAMWNKAEKDLADVLQKKGIKASDKKGDGAFYGPKIDVHIKDSLGRDWQLATAQLDFHQPEAFKLAYIDKDGQEKRPVMIHRAIFGSFERFIAILTEHYQGAFPLWLSPVQVTLMPIADRHGKTAEKIYNELINAGIRTELDNRAETLQSKIRDATLQKVNFMGIIGDKEIEIGDVISVRSRDGKDLGQLEVSKFLLKLQEEIDKKI